MSEIVVVLQVILKINPTISFMINIDTSSICKKIFTVTIWFLMLFDTFLLEKVFSTICFLQFSYDNNFFHVGPYFS